MFLISASYVPFLSLEFNFPLSGISTVVILKKGSFFKKSFKEDSFKEVVHLLIFLF